MMLTKVISVAQVSQNIICILQNITAGIYHELLDQNPDLWREKSMRKRKDNSFHEISMLSTKDIKRGHNI